MTTMLTISRSDLAEAWPFTVKKVRVSRAGLALIITSGGKQYAGNGSAIGQLQLPPPNPIWKISGHILHEGKKVTTREDIGLFIAYALSRTAPA